MLILSSRSIYSRIALSYSSVRALLVDARVLFDALPFHHLCNRRTGTWYTVAASVRFEYQPLWIASQVLLIHSSIAEYELKAMLLCNYTLIVTGKYGKIRRLDQLREECRCGARLPRLEAFLFSFKYVLLGEIPINRAWEHQASAWCLPPTWPAQSNVAIFYDFYIFWKYLHEFELVFFPTWYDVD